MGNRIKIIVTGSSGLIGTRLCEKLIEKNYNMVGIDKVPNKWNEEVNKNTIVADLLKVKTFKNLPTDIDMFIHLAATARVYKSTRIVNDYNKID